MSENWMKEWSAKLNMPEKTLNAEYEKAKKDMKELFPNQGEEIISEKAKMKIKVDYKKQMMSSAVPFVGVIIGNDNVRDPLEKLRKTQLEIYEKKHEKSQQTGDKSFENEVINKAVRIEDGKVIPLWPKLKANGEPSKLAGTDMMSPAESCIQMVYGICTPYNKQEPRAFRLELRGKACNQDLHKGKIVTFKAIDKSDTKETYVLSTNNTEFVPTTNEFLEEGIAKLGLAGIVSKFFKDNIATWVEVANWVSEKKRNPKKDVLPEKYKNMIILPDSLCIYQNFSPDKKNRIRMQLCSESDVLEDINAICFGEMSLEKSIDFAPNSKVLAIGRPWVSDLNESGEVVFILNLSGAFAYPDWKVPRVETKKLAEKDLIQPDISVAKETKQEDKFLQDDDPWGTNSPK